MIDGGRFAGTDLATGRSLSIEETITELDRWGVARAIVGSYRSIYSDVIEGARESVAWADRYPDRVEPLACLTTSYYGESPDTLLSRLKALGIRVVALVSEPSFHPVSWMSPAARAIGEAAARAGMVLQAAVRDEVELATVARMWSDLDVDVLIRWIGGHRYRSVASEIALAPLWARARFDVGNMTSTELIAWTASRIGPGRLFVASNAPFHIAACAYISLKEAGLNSAAQAAISSETLLRLLPARRRAATPAAMLDTLRDRPKVDIHWHPDHNNLGEPGLDDGAQLAAFDRYRYERVLMSSNRALYDDLREGNDVVLRWTERDPRAFGLVVVDPAKPEASLAEIDRLGTHPRFVGIKTIQDVHGIGLDDPAYEPLLERAEREGFPVMAHLGGVARAAQRYPGIAFVAAHANWGRAAHLASQRNVAFDFATSHSLGHETQLRRFVAGVGADRVLFGSDAPLIAPAWSLAKLLDAELDDSALDMILRENAYRLFPRLKRQ